MAKRENSKRLIMQTAIQLFRDQGYDQVSIGQICKACGVAYSTFYYQYKSKADIVLEYMDEEIKVVPDSLSLIMALPTALDRVMALWENYSQNALRLGSTMEALYYRLLFSTEGKPDTRYPHSGEYHTDLISPLIAQAQAEGDIRNLDKPEDLYVTTYYIAQAVYSLWSIHPDRMNLTEELLSQYETLLDVVPEKRKHRKP